MEERANGGNSLATSSGGLTVDDMLKKYPRKDVEWAIYSRDYAGKRNVAIQRYEEIIARDSNVETATRALDDLLKHTPSEPPIDPDEPADLDPDVLWRVRILKYIYRDSPIVRPKNILDLDTASVDPDTIINRDAVLNAYRRGDLKVVDGEESVWFAGNLVIGPLPSNELKLDDMIEKVPEWKKAYGPGRVWQEHPTKKFRQRKCQGVLHAADRNWTHLVS